MPSLYITTIPFRSSNLAIPPSPFSPRFPLTQFPLTKKPCGNLHSRDSAIIAQPPVIPLQWRWKCHKCRQLYPLGATRRCLEDGHNFCSGTSVVRSRRCRGHRVMKTHKPCRSEFDYVSWKILGDWRRNVHNPATKPVQEKKYCWNACDYPSECRWEKKLAHLQTSQSSPALPVAVSSFRDITPQAPSTTTFDAFFRADKSLFSKTKQKSPLTMNVVIEEVEEEDVKGDFQIKDHFSTPSLSTEAAAKEAAEMSTDLCIQAPKPTFQLQQKPVSGFDWSEEATATVDFLIQEVKELKSGIK